MRLAQIAMLDETGRQVWTGPLRQYLRDNNYTSADRRALIEDFRPKPHGRPEPVVVGGGAAPFFFLSLVS